MSGQLLDWEEGNGENMISEGGPVYDMVNSPPHYNQHGIEVIDLIKAYHADNYNLGAALKYLLRCNYKGHRTEDLHKCAWYILWELGYDKDSIRDFFGKQGNQS